LKKSECMGLTLLGRKMNKYLILFVLILSLDLFAQENSVIEFKNQSLIHNELLNNYKINKTPELQFDEEERETKSPGKAFFYSLLLPGLGEAYTGNTTYTKIFLSLEVIGWGFLLGNYQNVSWLERDYKNFAYQHSNISKNSKDGQYWIDIGKYDNIYEYNEQRRRDRDVNAIYDENANYYWRWDSYANRLNYDGQRIHAKDLENDDVYYIGAIVLNHIVSAINALRLAKAYNRNLKEGGWNMGVKFDRYKNSLSLSFNQNF
jgi:hypothetical protein